ncbi:MAG TPA: hypothetical protein VGV17_03165 [Bosea sp. (in: a-proteobacteria)]|jgi:hypothetical protein|uniref:hypothetical protein n=1 Tax=Bosea sp. (in: a-proteobacteria) TaxID=1871050 RepID=UPI002DDD0E63|nr:hypothetical protein [Bosea sp. (in: a-proteobacteria)]HEV2552746.1 hypothetical protein [Bosea sp. (in: a-proteobacteria)]
MTRPLHIPLSPGLPDAGAPGQWLGRDRHGAIYTLRWMPQKQCFGALGWSATHRKQPWPQLVLLQGEQEDFIVGHVEGPAIDADTAQREGFLTAALADLARDDREHSKRPWPGSIRSPKAPPLPPPDRFIARDGGSGTEATAWTPWFWTVAMLFGLPAAALALVVLAVWLTPKGDCKPDPARGTTGLFTCRSEP